MILPAIIYTPDFKKSQAVFCTVEETENNRFDVTVTTPITIDTTMRDLEVDLIVALSESGYRERINEIFTTKPIRK